MPKLTACVSRSGLLFCGRVADLYGRKFCYLGGLVVFLIFNILSAVVKVGSRFHTDASDKLTYISLRSACLSCGRLPG
jgi:MFS family permease